MKPRDHILPVLVFAALLAALYMIGFYAPVEREQGVVQKIFYFHVPSAWVSFLAFLVVFVFSFRYLTSREKRWDNRAAAAAEVGVMFCTVVLMTGPMWAKPVWGIWWTWDARLTLTLVLWLIYVAYLLLRHYVAGAEKRATLSAILGIVGFIDVPLVYFAIRWWRTQHPQPVFAGGQNSGLDPRMAATLWACVAAFTLLFIYLYRVRSRQLDLEDEIEQTHQKADDLTVPRKGAES
jgi:heme exporter protein C